MNISLAMTGILPLMVISIGVVVMLSVWRTSNQRRAGDRDSSWLKQFGKNLIFHKPRARLAIIEQT